MKQSGKMSMIQFVVVAVFLMVCCEKPNEPNKSDPDWIAASAIISGYEQIVLIDFNDPTNFKIVTNNDHRNIYPRFSPDRTKLVFLDKAMGFVHSPQVVLYSLADNSTTFLTDSLLLLGRVGANDPILWNEDGSVLYYRFRSSSFQDDFWRYDFASKRAFSVISTVGTSEYPVAMIDPDTLIAFSNDTATTKEPWGYYFMTPTGRYLSYLTNEHLRLINRGGITTKGAYYPNLNRRVGLLVYAETESTFAGHKVAITDLSGNYYNTYTKGDYVDDFAVWGPDDKWILFDRVETIGSPSPSRHRIMVLNLQSGEVKQFVDPAVIGGAYELRYPHY